MVPANSNPNTSNTTDANRLQTETTSTNHLRLPAIQTSQSQPQMPPTAPLQPAEIERRNTSHIEGQQVAVTINMPRPWLRVASITEPPLLTPLRRIHPLPPRIIEQSLLSQIPNSANIVQDSALNIHQPIISQPQRSQPTQRPMSRNMFSFPPPQSICGNAPFFFGESQIGEMSPTIMHQPQISLNYIGSPFFPNFMHTAQPNMTMMKGTHFSLPSNYEETSRILSMSNSSMKEDTRVFIKVQTWNKDSNGLFDYLARKTDYIEQTFTIKDGAKIYKHPKNPSTFIKLTEASGAQSKPPTDSILLGEITVEKNSEGLITDAKFTPQPFDNMSAERTIWAPFQAIVAEEEWLLKPGQIIRFGRTQYVVVEILNSQGLEVFREIKQFTDSTAIFRINSAERPSVKEDVTCKICLCNQQYGKDLLISPCLCKGSCNLIHISCLRTWVNRKVKTEHNKSEAASYDFKRFDCQICKHPLPNLIIVDETQRFEMLVVTKPKTPYILLEAVNQTTDPELQNEEKSVHIVCPDANAVQNVGRGQQSEIRLADISVSRNHAQIVFNNDAFYLKDKGSKFGTLVKLKDSYILTKEGSKIQCGRSLFNFNLVKGMTLEHKSPENQKK